MKRKPRSASPALEELEQLIRLIPRLSSAEMRRLAAVRACAAIREVVKSHKGGLDLPLWTHDEKGARLTHGPIHADVDMIRTKWTFKVYEGDLPLPISDGTANSEEEAKTAASNAVSGIILCNKLTRSDQA